MGGDWGGWMNRMKGLRSTDQQWQISPEDVSTAWGKESVIM